MHSTLSRRRQRSLYFGLCFLQPAKVLERDTFRETQSHGRCAIAGR